MLENVRKLNIKQLTLNPTKIESTGFKDITPSDWKVIKSCLKTGVERTKRSALQLRSS